MEQIPVSLTFLAGCKGGKDSICARISGDALNKTQSSPFPLTVIEDCVLAALFIVPLRNPYHSYNSIVESRHLRLYLINVYAYFSDLIVIFDMTI